MYLQPVSYWFRNNGAFVYIVHFFTQAFNSHATPTALLHNIAPSLLRKHRLDKYTIYYVNLELIQYKLAMKHLFIGG